MRKRKKTGGTKHGPENGKKKKRIEKGTVRVGDTYAIAAALATPGPAVRLGEDCVGEHVPNTQRNSVENGAAGAGSDGICSTQGEKRASPGERDGGKPRGL